MFVVSSFPLFVSSSSALSLLVRRRRFSGGSFVEVESSRAEDIEDKPPKGGLCRMPYCGRRFSFDRMGNRPSVLEGIIKSLLLSSTMVLFVVPYVVIVDEPERWDSLAK